MPDSIAKSPQGSRQQAAVEIALIVVLCLLVCGGLPPNVNEAHYLGKAKQYWQPDWCAGDSFLESSDAHQSFYWTLGWITLGMSLPAAAWLGRLLAWILFAWSFRRLCLSLFPAKWWSVLLAAIFLTLVRWGHMAGEWVIGGIEAKGFAFPLVFLGLEALVKNQWRRVWLFLGAAAGFHVLVGGWSVVAAGIAWLLSGTERLSMRRMWPYLMIGGLLSLPGLLPAVTLNSGVSPEVLQEANDIYVNQRLAHHLLLQDFSPWFVARHLGLWVLCLVAWRLLPMKTPYRRFTRFVAGALCIALMGAVLSLFHEHPRATALLRFYWFRLSDVAVPLAATFAIVDWLFARPPGDNKASGLRAALFLIVATSFGDAVIREWVGSRSGADRQSLARGIDREDSRLIHQDWLRACRWIAASDIPADARFLTPRRQQTFKWYAQRPEVNNWKDVPQDARSIVAWEKRQRDVYTPGVMRFGLEQMTTRDLLALCRRHKAQFVLMERANPDRRSALPLVFPAADEPPSYYEVFRVPAESTLSDELNQ